MTSSTKRSFGLKTVNQVDLKNSSGKIGKDLFIRIPVGVIVADLETQTVVDMDKPGMKLLVARGGRGGKGNARMATATRRAPRFRELGHEGEMRRLRLELKLVAHVGLVGYLTLEIVTHIRHK